MADEARGARGDERLAEAQVRPARAEDREAVLRFCAKTWNDGDYIEEVWERWLADNAGADGALLVATVATLTDSREAPIGLLHLRRMSEDDAWIEGIRVDPAYRRQGVGGMLLSRALTLAHARGMTVARLFTSSENIGSQRLSARFGFARVAEVVRYAAPALGVDDAISAGEETASAGAETASGEPGAEVEMEDGMEEQTEAGDETPDGEQTPRLLLAGPEDAERIWAWLEQSNLTPFNGGVEFDGWAARGLGEQALDQYLAEGQVWLLEEWGSIQALAITSLEAAQRDATGTDAPARLGVRYLDGQADAIGRLALTLREIAADERAQTVHLWLPDLLILRDAMSGAGYTQTGDHAMWVYARSL